MPEFIGLLEKFGFPTVVVFGLVVFIWKFLWPQYVSQTEFIINKSNETTQQAITTHEKVAAQFTVALEKRDKECSETANRFVATIEKRDIEFVNAMAKVNDKLNDLILEVKRNSKNA